MSIHLQGNHELQRNNGACTHTRAPPDARTARLQGQAQRLQAQLLTVLDAELWVPCAVPQHVQAFLSSIAGPPLDATLAPTSGEEYHKAVVPSGEFYVVNSVLVLVQHMQTLLAFSELPCELHYEVGSRLADLVKLANGRSQQLVLGAGAIATVGLKSISARHMAVCSQVLLLLEGLLPGLRRRALRGVVGGNATQLATVLDAVAEVRLLRSPSSMAAERSLVGRPVATCKR